MYTPAHNREPDRAKIIAFMRQYSFATVITTYDGKLNATHLPALIRDEGDDLKILAHVSKANQQWHDFDASVQQPNEALMIFQEPHAFISTRHYERPLSVPTWNYVAVHAYGRIQILPSLEQRLSLVREMVQEFEGNLDQWNALPLEFKESKANGIVAFELDVTRLDARFKLSQDRTRVEQENIVTTLRESPNTLSATIGEMMSEQLRKE